MKLNYFVLDDHLSAVDATTECVLTTQSSKFIKSATSIIEAYNYIYNEQNVPDIVILDIQLPSYPQKKINDGIEFAILLRRDFPMTKIIFLSQVSCRMKINGIINTINPEGFLTKSDVNIQQIAHAIIEVVNGNVCYSKTVKESISLCKPLPFLNDPLTQSIILMMAERYTNKEIADANKVSESTIEKRKRIIKQYLDMENKKDAEIIIHLKNLSLL